MDEIKNYKYLLSYNLQYFASDDKTEEPTTKKLSDARKEGKVALSKELNTAAGLAALFFALKIFSGYFANNLMDFFHGFIANISLIANEEYSGALFQGLLNQSLLQILIICLPAFVIGTLVIVVVLLVQVQWKITTEPLRPKFDKMNPVNGFKRIFSKHKVMELMVEIVKIGIISIYVYNKFMDEYNMLLNLYDLTLIQAVAVITDMVIDLGITISMIFLVLGVADLFYQRFKFKKDMRMTKQEIKDEYKQQEGDPKVKSQIKARMREASQRRMMQAIPQADVVITNPTHFAAAIRYDKESSDAPILVAKGADFLAAKIKEIAKENHVIIVENKPLARMLYYNVEIDQQVPPELYQMTAEVLAYVYSLKN